MTAQEQTREIDNREQIKRILDKISRTQNINGERLKIIEEDLKWGLTEDDVDRYDNKMSIDRMRCISVCMRKRVPKNIENMILEGDFNGKQTEKVVEIYNEVMAERDDLDTAITAGFIELVGQCEELAKLIKEARAEIIAVADKPAPEPVVIYKEPEKVESTEEVKETVSETPVIEADYITATKQVVEIRRPGKKLSLYEKIAGMPPLISTLIKRVAKSELDESHLAVIKDALTAGLSDKLIIRLVGTNADAKKMRDLVDLSMKYRAIEKEA